ncbi:unnamed protein product [Cuscuta epithymum]|uniref:Dirigent protein n=1 Tax=Cuscuta epithymum TaxID=186058 RepID=A0AAV0F115_9ASTE|nr:unnamed protein product [Cuscuta epithymum]
MFLFLVLTLSFAPQEFRRVGGSRARADLDRCFCSGAKKMSLEFVKVGLQGSFQDAGFMAHPPSEPPPRMMVEVWFLLLCQLILFNFVSPFLSFLVMNIVAVVFCNFYFSQTLTLGGGDGGFALATFGSIRPATGSTNHIAFSKVIDSPAGSRVGGWKYFLYLLCPLLNVLLSI